MESRVVTEGRKGIVMAMALPRATGNRRRSHQITSIIIKAVSGKLTAFNFY
jgi:hypothetical protein